MTEESRRVHANASDRTRHVTYECRHCLEVTHVYVPDSTRFKVYRYDVCAECAAVEWGKRIGVRVALAPRGALG